MLIVMHLQTQTVRDYLNIIELQAIECRNLFVAPSGDISAYKAWECLLRGPVLICTCHKNVELQSQAVNITNICISVRVGRESNVCR